MKFQAPKGTRDYLPEEMIARQQAIDRIKTIFETFGFQPLETSALESWEVLSAKGAGGSDVLKETYNFKDLGGKRIGLRYDLTVPLARVIASNPSIPLPFKRYQIQNAWRYGDVTKGRFREFLQADIDTIGSSSMIADSEIIACAISAFIALGFKKFFVRLNNRKILTALIKYIGLETELMEIRMEKGIEDMTMNIFRAIDKLEKIGLEGVKHELSNLGISKKMIEKIVSFIEIKGDSDSVLKKADKMLGDIKEGAEGIDELKQIIKYLKKMGVKPESIKIDLSLARGLDYYTGPIFEVFAEEEIGSLAGGGRYDKMIGLFLGRNIPATGISFGIERIIEVMKNRKMIKQGKSKTKVFVAAVNDEVRDDVLRIVQDLRSNYISSDFDVRGRKLTKQLEYVDALGIPYAIIVGEKEIKENRFKLKDMKKKVEKELGLEEIVKLVK